MVENDAFLEPVAFFVFIFEEEGFKLGVIMMVELDKGLNAGGNGVKG